jgi:GntR family transcriptional regulator/MocR family aminotransferase
MIAFMMIFPSVSRGTVRVAYARLIAEQFAIGLGPATARVP